MNNTSIGIDFHKDSPALCVLNDSGLELEGMSATGTASFFCMALLS